jgi:hypothetical protein
MATFNGDLVQYNRMDNDHRFTDNSEFDIIINTEQTLDDEFIVYNKDGCDSEIVNYTRTPSLQHNNQILQSNINDQIQSNQLIQSDRSNQIPKSNRSNEIPQSNRSNQPLSQKPQELHRTKHVNTRGSAQNVTSLTTEPRCQEYSKQFEHNKILIQVHISDVQAVCQKWQKNRPADELRVKEIMHNIKQKKFVSGIIYVWSPNDVDYLIYDGLHRFLAAQKLFLEEQIDMSMVFSIYRTDDEKDIEEDYLNINKSVPAPELYVGDSNFRIIIHDAIKILCTHHHGLVSTSRNPQKPRFNRDTLTDVLLDTISTFQFSSENLVNILYELNEIMKKKYNTPSTKDALREKCLQNNLFLFVNGISTFQVSLQDLIAEKFSSNDVDL